IRVKDNPELLRKVEQLLKDAGETVYRNTTKSILEDGWGFLTMDYDGEWMGTSGRFVESRGLTEVNLKELTLILGEEWDESLDPETGESLDEPLLVAEKESDFMQIAKGVAELLEYKNKQYGNSALNPINVFAGKSK